MEMEHVAEVLVRAMPGSGHRAEMRLFELMIDGKLARSQISYLGIEEIKSELEHRGFSIHNTLVKPLPIL